jgi:hypothetical protein
MAAITKDSVSAGPAVTAPVPVSTKMPGADDSADAHQDQVHRTEHFRQSARFLGGCDHVIQILCSKMLKMAPILLWLS